MNHKTWNFLKIQYFNNILKDTTETFIERTSYFPPFHHSKKCCFPYSTFHNIRITFLVAYTANSAPRTALHVHEHLLLQATMTNYVITAEYKQKILLGNMQSIIPHKSKWYEK